MISASRQPRNASVAHRIFPDGLPGILLRIVTTVPTTVLFTWCFNRTKGNLWLVVLLHTAVNNSGGFWLPVTLGVYAAMAIMTLTLIITDRMWRMRPPEDTMAPAVVVNASGEGTR
ncbi:hypothetical protein K2Z83_23060 [Oscillochloris sp. ZM17-4]|uniref:CPBP family glutamic-type intramembrane protease n=1 Tax=Oscillochloris sp. ZM17-4 TaxID=2866714 RepID=UPI001C73C400|nr:CPBP family glutamic-type intramembrane protease [Oscillochloris sp. ZM17-4]MBX0330540.1 hypothetical protein [Oscillochloris sp. ZM17-4]